MPTEAEIAATMRAIPGLGYLQARNNLIAARAVARRAIRDRMEREHAHELAMAG